MNPVSLGLPTSRLLCLSLSPHCLSSDSHCILPRPLQQAPNWALAPLLGPLPAMSEGSIQNVNLIMTLYCLKSSNALQSVWDYFPASWLYPQGPTWPTSPASSPALPCEHSLPSISKPHAVPSASCWTCLSDFAHASPFAWNMLSPIRSALFPYCSRKVRANIVSTGRPSLTLQADLAVGPCVYF